MHRVLAVFTLILLTSSLSAQPPARTHDITPDDYASVATVTELAVSPDGKQVAYCLATWDAKADNRKTELWVVPTDGKGQPIQLTSDRANDRHPKWSADGKSIYVLSNRALPLVDRVFPQVWKVPAEGGDPVAITTQPPGIVAYDYAAKIDTVFFTRDASETEADAFAELRKKYPKPEYAVGKRTVSELFTLKDDGPPKLVLAPKRYIREFAVPPDGTKVAMVTAHDDTVVKSEGESRVDVFDMFEGKLTTPPTDVYRAKAASPWAWLEGLAWNPDGTRFAFCAIFDGHPAEVIIVEAKDGAWATKQMARQDKRGVHIRGYGSPLWWISPTELMSFCEKDASVGFYHVDVRDQPTSSSIRQGSVFYAWAGRIWLRGEENAFPEVSFYTEKDLKPLTNLNATTKSWKLPSVSHITWKSNDGTDVGGVLELPPGYKRGDAKLPLVVAIHGGPTTASYANLQFDPHNGRLYFSAKGYAVLCPNYRGSTGYGDKFVTDLIGRENDIEVKDIIAGIQHLIKEGIVDPERIGVMGWSNGGYLTNCLIALKDSPVKFKAASSGAGIVDTIAEWGFNDEPAYPRVFKKGLPWETPKIYRKTSPTYQLGNITTPTLIHVGGNDDRCPPGHSRMLYRALKEYLNVPTQLVVYPGEPHGLSKLSNRKAKMEWDLAWFDKYLLGK